MLAVPREAIQRVEGRTLVFVKTDDAFQRRQIETGVSTGDEVEVRSGLTLGDLVAADGAFLLKSEMLR